MDYKKIQKLLLELRDLDIKIWSDGDRLRYQAPKGTMTPDILQKLQEQKAEILSFLCSSVSTKNDNFPAILPIKRNEKLRLSFAQERLWFINQLEGNSPLYNISSVTKIEGNLNISALEKAIQHLCERHESLRTNFVNQSGKPFLRISEETKPRLEIVKTQHLSPRERENIIEQKRKQTLNLENDRLVQFNLIQISPTENILVILIHHIISDGWSMGILKEELSRFYQSYSENKTPNLPTLSIQYLDFAAWQRKYLQGEKLDKQLSYWQKQLEGIPPLLELPTDNPRPPQQSYQGKSLKLNLSSQLIKQLKQISKEQESTLFMTVLTVFGILLSKYSNQNDLVIGTAIANRNYSQCEEIIGFFANTLALRINIENNHKFWELLAQVKETTLGAYEHQDLPFEKLVEEINPERSLSHNPIFQVMLAWNNTPEKEEKWGDLTVQSQGFQNRGMGNAKFDLLLAFKEQGEKVTGVLNYNSDLFNEVTIIRMIEHFQVLLSGITNNSNQKISELELLTKAEKKQILFDWNNTQVDYPKEKCIHQLFEEQVIKTPDNIAVVFKQENLTYQQLNEKANQLAYYLRKLGMEKDCFIGIFLERSPKLIISMLAILKLGCAYVPLDINYPLERLYFMLEDAKINLIITETKLDTKLAKYQGNIVNLDVNNNLITKQSKLNLDNKLNGKNLAYIIYTSGSTGKPKGVKITHKSVNRLVCNCNYIKINSRNKIAQIANTSFDAATFEIWGALLNGAQLIIFLPENTLEINLFINQLREKEIDIIFITTALLNQIVSIKPQAFTFLKYLLFGGEKAEIKWIREIINKGKPENLIHVYGPTENTTFSTWYSVDKISNSTINLPIGKPINNTEVYILDSNLQPLPIGVTGEIYLGAEGLARGYLNRPELTKQKFINNPFGEGKLYKTGDRGRYLTDGNIEFIDRIDTQVKIRGFRIELGEIETNLSQHPKIKETIVLAKENVQGEKYLTAYLIAQESKPEIKELRQFLGQRLPEYMIPSVFVFLDAFPLTANGKIDRKALPEADFEHNLEEEEFIAPRNEIEIKLAQIWQEVLRIEKISINDDFFALGGNSLLTIRLVYEIEKQLGKKIPVKSLFQLLTIENIAQSITENKQEQDNKDFLSRINKTQEKEYFFQLTEGEKLGLLASTNKGKRVNNDSLIMLEQRGQPEQYKPLFFVYLLGKLRTSFSPSLPVYNLTAWTKVEKSETFIKALGSYYVTEIIKIQPEGPYFIGGFCFGGLIALEIAQQLTQQGKEVANLILVETPSSDPSYRKYKQICNRLGYEFFLKVFNNIRLLIELEENQEKRNFFLEKMTNMLKHNKLINKLVNYQQRNHDNFSAFEFDNEIIDDNSKLEEEILLSLKQAINNYECDQYSGKVSLFFGRESGLHSFLFPKGGWQNIFTGELSIHLIKGHHASILEGSSVKLLGKMIGDKINRPL